MPWYLVEMTLGVVIETRKVLEMRLYSTLNKLLPTVRKKTPRLSELLTDVIGDTRLVLNGKLLAHIKKFKSVEPVQHNIQEL